MPVGGPVVPLARSMPQSGAFLRRLARRYRAHLGQIAIASFVGAIVEAAFLVTLTSVLLGAAAGQTTVELVGRSVSVRAALVGATAAIVFRLVMNLVAVRLSARLSGRVMRDERHRLARAYLNASWSLQYAQRSGLLQELLTTFVNRVNGAVAAVGQGLTAALSLVAFLSAGLIVNTLATLAILLALLALGVVLSPIRRLIRRRSEVAVEDSVDFAAEVAEFSALGLEMQAFGVTNAFSVRIDVVTDRTSRSFARMQSAIGSMSPTYTFMAYIALVGGALVLISRGAGNPAPIGAVMLLMLRSLSYGQQLSNVLGVIASTTPTMRELDSKIAEYLDSSALAGQVRPKAMFPLTFTGVNYAYPDGTHALTDLTFDIRAGEMIGVIGPSGGGKSTLAQVILGLRTPTGGDILLDGTPMADVDRAWFTASVAFVPQTPLLFTGTVADNVRFLREGITDEMILQACADANVLVDVEAMDSGLRTHLGERGGSLSGGQRQRLSIARALAGRPRFIVLDEPTSALDNESEALIRRTLASLHGDVTLLIIAHRMSTIELCDRIMVVDGGILDAFDKPDRLRASSDFYRTAMQATRAEGRP